MKVEHFENAMDAAIYRNRSRDDAIRELKWSVPSINWDNPCSIARMIFNLNWNQKTE